MKRLTGVLALMALVPAAGFVVWAGVLLGAQPGYRWLMRAVRLPGAAPMPHTVVVLLAAVYGAAGAVWMLAAILDGQRGRGVR